jgi:hypothetical protein
MTAIEGVCVALTSGLLGFVAGFIVAAWADR